MKHLLVAAALALSLLVAAPVPADEASTECTSESTIVDGMSGAGWKLAGYYQNDGAVAFIEQMGGGLPHELTPADFSAVQVWGFPPDTGRMILFDRNGCAILVGNAPLATMLDAIAALRRTST